MRVLLLLCVSLWTAACVGDPPRSNPPPARDAEPADAGAEPDADPPPDTGAPDVGLPPPPDAGVPPDSGGERDASPPDADPDAGVTGCPGSGSTDVPLPGTGEALAHPKIVWTGSGYGIMWTEVEPVRDYTEVYFARLTSDGQYVANSLRQVSLDDDELAEAHRLVWSGNEFGALLHQAGTSRHFVFVRIDAAGEVIPGSHVSLPENAGWDATFTSAALAWSPVTSEWAVAWSEREMSLAEPIRGWFQRFDANGAVVPGSLVQLSGQAYIGEFGSPMIWAGTHFVLSYTQIDPGREGVFVTEIGSDGVPGQPTDIIASRYCGHATLAWSGSELGIAWIDYSVAVNGTFFFGRLDASGLIPGSAVQLPPGGDQLPGIDLAWNGSSFGVTWSAGVYTHQEIYFDLLDASGNLIPRTERRVGCGAPERSHASLTTDGTRWVVLYRHGEYPPTGWEPSLHLLFFQ